MTEAIYLEVSEKTETAKKAGRRVSVSGMLKFLGVSRSGYLAWLHHVPSDTEKRCEAVKAKIQDIYDNSKQNYGAPKITVELRKTGEVISERTVGTYMRQMGIRAQWSKPWTITTKDSDFSTELHNILDEQYNHYRQNAVWCSDITYIWTIDGFVYLTSVMDLFSRKIIAWTLSETLEVSCVIDTGTGGNPSTRKKSVETVAKEVLAGKWGNGEYRKKKLQAVGYDYPTVQTKVNELVKGSGKKSVEAVAKEVIAGKWGNGEDRKKRLQAAGYDYGAVQRKVNELMR